MSLHRSRIDLWLAVVLGAAPVFVLVLIGVGLAARRFEAIPVLASVLVLWVVIGWGLMFPMEYEVAPDGLHVRAGRWIRVFVPWDRMGTVAYSYNPLSSPAFSLRRLRVNYRTASGRESFVLISPKDRDAFLRDVAEVNPLHRVEGKTLVRR